MGRIPRLKRIHCIGTLLLELLHNFGGSLAPFVQSVVVSYTIKELDFPTNEIIATLVDFFYVRMAGVNDSKHSSDYLLLAVRVHLWVAEDGNNVSHLGGECNSIVGGTLDGRFGVVGAAEGDGNAHGNAIGGTELLKRLKIGRGRLNVLVFRQIEWINENGVEMQHLEQSALPHESPEGGGPPLANDLEPVEVQVGDQHLGQAFRLLRFGSLEVLRNMKVDHLVAIGVGQTRRTNLRRPLQNPVHLQPTK
mmetsp:Transcript_33349/g.70087  ORF Transcript_33349/g.70087 Transcript_33349/m.70087 type:complete len:250 (-) Transcript_33349:1252-2001(-)